MRTSFFLVRLAVLEVACVSGVTVRSAGDGGEDAGTSDAGLAKDAGAVDAGANDAGSTEDAGVEDPCPARRGAPTGPATRRSRSRTNGSRPATDPTCHYLAFDVDPPFTANKAIAGLSH